MTSEDGQKAQKKVWRELEETFEHIQPGINGWLAMIPQGQGKRYGRQGVHKIEVAGHVK